MEVQSEKWYEFTGKDQWWCEEVVVQNFCPRAKKEIVYKGSRKFDKEILDHFFYVTEGSKVVCKHQIFQLPGRHCYAFNPRCEESIE